MSSTISESKPVALTFTADGRVASGIPETGRKVRRIAEQLRAAGTPFTLTVSETEYSDSTRLFYWFTVKESAVRRPHSYGSLYASYLCAGVRLSVAHAGSGGRTCEAFAGGTKQDFGKGSKKLKTARDFVQWANITCAHPYKPTPEQAAEDAVTEAKYQAAIIA